MCENIRRGRQAGRQEGRKAGRVEGWVGGYEVFCCIVPDFSEVSRTSDSDRKLLLRTRWNIATIFVEQW